MIFRLTHIPRNTITHTHTTHTHIHTHTLSLPLLRCEDKLLVCLLWCWLALNILGRICRFNFTLQRVVCIPLYILLGKSLILKCPKIALGVFIHAFRIFTWRNAWNNSLLLYNLVLWILQLFYVLNKWWVVFVRKAVSKRGKGN